MMKCRLACRSTRNSILPPLMSVTALATSTVTVPVFGLGIRPRGPSTRPSRPTLPIRSGRGHDGVEVEVAPGHLLDQLVRADLVGAGGHGGLRPVTGGEDEDPRRLAGAVGQVDRAADHLVRLARVDPEPHRDVDRLVELGLGVRLGDVEGLVRGVELRRRRPSRRRRCRPCCASCLVPFYGQFWCEPRRPSHGFNCCASLRSTAIRRSRRRSAERREHAFVHSATNGGSSDSGLRAS